jgi:bacteriocin-like protein
MERIKQAIDVTELSDEDLENVTGGGLLNFIKQIVVMGTGKDGTGTETDSNIATHTQSWRVSAS